MFKSLAVAPVFSNGLLTTDYGLYPAMAKKTKEEDDILWKMLSSEMAMPEVREMQQFLEGETEHFEMGYGDLNIEPYDTRGGRSRMFRIRHPRYGETIISHAALRSVLHDLVHHLRGNYEL